MFEGDDDESTRYYPVQRPVDPVKGDTEYDLDPVKMNNLLKRRSGELCKLDGDLKIVLAATRRYDEQQRNISDRILTVEHIARGIDARLRDIENKSLVETRVRHRTEEIESKLRHRDEGGATSLIKTTFIIAVVSGIAAGGLFLLGWLLWLFFQTNKPTL